jgi:hypothetical protein
MGQSSSDATTKDAQIKSSKEECASGMGQSANYAAAKDAKIKYSKEECAAGMGQREFVEAKDAQTGSSKEECALGMGQSRNDIVKFALLMDAPIRHIKEVCVAGTGRAAATKDVLTKSSMQECA